jgi:hypothetical protein
MATFAPQYRKRTAYLEKTGMVVLFLSWPVATQDVNRIMHKINRRPREKLNFATPIECFYEKLS